MQETEFEIDRNAVGKYFLVSFILQNAGPPGSVLAFIGFVLLLPALIGGGGKLVFVLGIIFILLVVFGLFVTLLVPC